MSEKLWYKLARNILKGGGPPVPIDKPLIELLKTLINEDQMLFLLNFNKPMNFEELKSKTNLSEPLLYTKLNELMDIGMITGIPSRNTEVMVYRLVGYLPGLLEFTLMRGEKSAKQVKIAELWEQIFNGAREMTQKNYESFMNAYKQAPPIDRVIPVETQIEPHKEEVIPYEDVTKIVEKFDIIGVSHCYCRHRKLLLNDPCKVNAPLKNCLSFGRSAKFAIDHKFATQITKEQALKLLKEAEKLGLVHKGFHVKANPELEEMAICNCCKCCCGNFQGYYTGTSPTHTYTSYIAKVHEESCVGCRTCTDLCPIEAPSLVNEIAKIDDTKCMGCGVCAQQCPEHAIELIHTGLRTVFIPAPKILSS
jgi:Pyruvate/2-oxoacid:ferredoxin oxidoreductase delta subunit/DNA-binding HxlR family transcriptional regulator